LALASSFSILDLAPMSRSHIDVRYVANLARLELTDDEVARFQPQLEAILAHADALAKVDVSGIDSAAHPSPTMDHMRSDTPHQSLTAVAFLQNAPDQSQGQIRVPKVVTDA
jgi:aspartyl-tRNA(Asn)/glutamyl-tRNA(Gln) amidotransferase subunit C